MRRVGFDYNIPSNNRELQLIQQAQNLCGNYNIPSNNRELQLHELTVVEYKIITYQVITGNYSVKAKKLFDGVIITYQVITGNYSMRKNRRK